MVDCDKSIDIATVKPAARVALRNDSYALHVLLPSKVDPLVSLMKVEKVPDSTYDLVGGLDQQARGCVRLAARASLTFRVAACVPRRGAHAAFHAAAQIKEIKEVVELPIKHPELFDALGIAQPKGVLLYGPPGTGKTLLARAVAHHTDCTFIRVSGSELVQKYIGEGSRMVRELFVMARCVLFPRWRACAPLRHRCIEARKLTRLPRCSEHAPSIIFMDEIDSIGSACPSACRRVHASASLTLRAAVLRRRAHGGWVHGRRL